MQRFMGWARKVGEWVRRNVALVVTLDVVLSLGLFGVIQLQQGQINGNSAKNDCWSSVLDGIVTHQPPAVTHHDIAKAEECKQIP